MSGLILKILAAILMVADHVFWLFPNMPVVFNILGRFCTPIFFFLLIEGYFKTRNKLSHIIRLYIFGGLMLFGNLVLSSFFMRSDGLIINVNIFLSMAVSLSVLYSFELAKNNQGSKKMTYILTAIVFAVASLFTEGSYIALSMCAGFYLSYGSKKKTTIYYISISIVLALLPMLLRAYFVEGVVLSQAVIYDNQWFMIFAIIPILLYNGKRGFNNNIVKYSFYIFYPIHIWLLYMISYVMQVIK